MSKCKTHLPKEIHCEVCGVHVAEWRINASVSSMNDVCQQAVINVNLCICLCDCCYSDLLEKSIKYPLPRVGILG